MIQEWLLQLVIGLGKLFIHPIFYFSFLLAVVAGTFRVSRERKDFGIRVYDIYQEVRYILPSSLLLGLVLSILTIAAGLALPADMFNFIAAVTIILSIAGFRLLSPAWTLGTVFIVFLLATAFGWDFIMYSGLSLNGIFMTLSLLVGLLVITEGILVLKRGWQGTSPRLNQTPRGLKMGVHVAQRLWLVPVFLLLPTGEISGSWDWWPVVSIGAQNYSFICFPFLIGFVQQVKSTLPELAVKTTGKNIITLGAVSLLLAISAYWFPVASAISTVIAIIGRFWISWRHHAYEQDRNYFFTPQSKGVMILGVIPYTPARKMKLEIGEIVRKVNGIEVNTESQFYEALQKNAAYCKLEVVDVNGQLRFVQGSLYEGEHHELGLLLAEEEKRYLAEVE